MWLQLIETLVVLNLCSGELDQLKGVPLPKRPFYNPDKDFTCLDGSQTISFSWVNDDYCDCADGSDEPGTSACPNGRFHCVNAGHVPMNLLSSRVNDQICDCCDGSDEYNGHTSCPNICDELGRKARLEAERMEAAQREGYQKRQEMIKEAQKIIEEKQQRLTELQKQKADLDPSRDILDLTKKDAEELESAAKKKHDDAWAGEKEKRRAERNSVKAKAAFEDLDANKNGKLEFVELKDRIEFDKDGDGTVSLDEAKEVLADEEPDLEQFQSVTWETIKDIYKPSAKDDLGEVDDFDPDGEGKEEEKEEEEAPPYDDETIALMDAADKAREEFNKVEKQMKELETEIKNLEEFFKLDLGPNREFAPIKGQCFDKEEREYVYKLCIFDRTVQKQRSGGQETSLGHWGEWSGPEDNKYARMKFSGGQNCWSGPDRSTEVKLVCGAEHQLVGASEPGRCQYAFDFITPLACGQPPPEGHPPHEDL